MYVELYAFHPNLLQTSVNIVYHERKKNRRETWAFAKNFMQEKGKKICKQHVHWVNIGSEEISIFQVKNSNFTLSK